MNIIIKILLNSVAVYVTAYLLDAIVLPDFTTALLVALVLGVINATIKPIVKILTLPLNILTLGLFGLVINGAALYLATYIVPGFVITGFLWAILAALLISFLVTLSESLLGVD
jgi:putative membrane protein